VGIANRTRAPVLMFKQANIPRMLLNKIYVEYLHKLKIKFHAKFLFFYLRVAYPIHNLFDLQITIKKK